MFILKKNPRYLSDENIIWRYMDFSKFVDLLDSQCLFFSRLSKLRKDDPYEGSYIRLLSSFKKDKSIKKSLKKSDKILPQNVFVSCWHLSDVESAALWKLYTKRDEGIAIKSTVGKLNSSLCMVSNNTTIIQDVVKYGHENVSGRKSINSKSISFSGDDAVFTKRRSFEHEKELRLVIYSHELTPLVPLYKPGSKVKVNLESMISEIIIGPEARTWIYDLVKRITKKYCFSFKIEKSTLNKLLF